MLCSNLPPSSVRMTAYLAHIRRLSVQHLTILFQIVLTQYPIILQPSTSSHTQPFHWTRWSYAILFQYTVPPPHYPVRPKRLTARPMVGKCSLLGFPCFPCLSVRVSGYLSDGCSQTIFSPRCGVSVSLMYSDHLVKVYKKNDNPTLGCTRCAKFGYHRRVIITIRGKGGHTFSCITYILNGIT